MAKIVFAGYLVRFPVGGYFWQAAHYLAGFRALGHDVWFYEDCGNWGCRSAFNPSTRQSEEDYRYGLSATAAFLGRIGFGDRWVFADLERGVEHGPGAGRASELIRDADLLVSFGVVNREPVEVWNRSRPAIFIDADPVYNQVKLANGDAELKDFLDRHTHLFSFGENIGTPRSSTPTGGYEWRPTRQPVVLEFWRGAGGPGNAYTTIGTWNSAGRDLSYQGQTFEWRKRTEWMRYLSLPARTGKRFEIATDAESVPGDPELLASHGWAIADPVAISADADGYRDFIQNSRGEFTVAKEMNVIFRSGWFSDRAACYLAAGRPVIEQDTAFGDVLPLGPGLHAFNDLDQAIEAVHEVESDYSNASTQAREIAAEYFDAERVLRSILEAVGL